MGIKILLADDHDVVRRGLRSMLEQHAGMEIVAEAEDGRAAVELARQHSPDVAVIDITMPELNGIEATRQIMSHLPHIKVIALSLHSERKVIDDVLAAGARGYLLKNSAALELIAAIKAVMRGDCYLSPRVTQVVVTTYLNRPQKENSAGSSHLTPKEREVLQLLAEGKTNKEVATRLNISSKTAETHRAQIMNKLGIHTVAELTKYAIREGLTSVEA